MARSKFTIVLVAVLVWTASLAGCKDEEKEKAVAEAAQVKAELAELKQSLEQATSDRDSLKAELAEISESLDKTKVALDAATQERSKLQEWADKLKSQLDAATDKAKTFQAAAEQKGELLAERMKDMIAAARGKMGGYIGTAAPEGAVVLFDGKDYSNWLGRGDEEVKWNIVDGAMEVKPRTGSIYSKQEFNDCRLHIEFKVPLMGPEYKGEKRGNSGVYIQYCYEIQILDSFGKEPGTGDCGAIYGIRPPDKNASKEAEQWQSFDVYFRAARFEGEGENLKKTENARVTILHNGVVIHNNVEIPHKCGGGRDETPEPGPIMLQDHRNKMQFRNIWVVPL